MADEREHGGMSGGSADQDKIQTGGREANAAQPLNAAEDHGGPERYPSVRQDDAVEATGRTEQVTGRDSGQGSGRDSGQDSGETRSFDPSADAPTPGTETPTTAEGDFPVSANEGRLGPGADPVEGPR